MQNKSKYFSGTFFLLPFILTLCLTIIFPSTSHSQIHEPDGLRMPGTWNGWVNNHNMGGVFNLQKTSVGTQRWQTIFQFGGSGGEQSFKFVSGTSNPWQNEWRNTAFSVNTLQAVGYSGASTPDTNNTVFLTQNKWYTVVWEDNGYNHTRAIFMETSSEPVTITNVSTPVQAEANEAVVITVTLNQEKSPEEIIFVRYTTNAWASSGAVMANMSGTTGTAIIPGQPAGSVVGYYAFSSTVPGISSDYDLYTIRLNNNGGPNYSYTIEGTPSVQIDWANLQWPPIATIEPDQPFDVYGQVWIENQTGGPDPFPGLQAWVGFSTENVHPEQWINWIAASHSGPVGNNDEFVADIGSHISVKDTYYYATRFQSDDQDFVYGGYSASGGGFWNGTNNVSGVLTVGHTIDCTVYRGVAFADPSFPVQNQPLTIYFNAELGNSALSAYTGDVYAHTAVITNLSNGPEDWRYTKTAWGQNTPETLLTRLGDNLYSLTIANPINYYGVPVGETIEQLVFVFRSGEAQGNGLYLSHRNADETDIYVPIYEPGLHVRFLNPTQPEYLLNPGSTMPLCAEAVNHTQLSFYVNDQLIVQDEAETLSYMLVMQQLLPGMNWLVAVAENNGSEARDSIEVYRRGPVQIAELPEGANKGINYVNDETVTLVLHDPAGLKQFVYVIGDFNAWEISETELMNRTPSGNYFWLTITGLDSDYEYGFQYFIDGEIKIADPYAEKVLDPWNDQWISSGTYPDLKPYPHGLTSGLVSVFHINRPVYQWQVPDFIPPALNNTQSDLLVYELLIRDFVDSRQIKDVEQKLDYLKELGVNAIQLMPIMEFDGNDSWGYAPNLFFATDKYYGTRQAYKEFIDAAHQRDIAVILDIVPNHALGQNPFVLMYFDPDAGGYGQPAWNNPWLNPQAPHPYSIGYDFNHENPHTRQFFKDVFQYWLTEFKVDGFRIDLSKGLTQNQTGNFGEWNAYDQSRINILTDYYNHIKWVNPNAYVILEHFANNDEETVLANTGMLLYSAMHHVYKQVAMGWEQSSDLSWAFHGNRGWNYPNLLDYMENHDEERMMFEALSNGNSSGSYNITDTLTALNHQEQALVLFMGIPGPKMLWQFQEMGYDYSIFFNGGRTAPKPPRWDYMDHPQRERLHRVVFAMASLRKSDAFRYGNFSHDFSGNGKRMWIAHSSMDVVISANIGVNGFDMMPGFTKTGTWYNYFTGESFYVSDPGGHFFWYGPGEYKVFTSEPLPKPFHELEVTVVENLTNIPLENVTVQLGNAGNRQTDVSGKAYFLAFPQQVSIHASKFGWKNNTVTATISGNSVVTVALDAGWDPSSVFANLQWPPSASLFIGDELEVFAQVEISEIPLTDTGYEHLQVWVGYHTANTNPSEWINWIPAIYNGISTITNRPEYSAMIGSDIAAEGTYFYASRFQLPGQSFNYGGYSASGGGFWDGVDNTSGVLTLTVEPPNYGILDNGGINLPRLTYWYSGLGSDITQQGSAFNNTNLGNITDLFVKGASFKTWKSVGGDVTGSQFKYKVWNTIDTEPSEYSLRNVGWTSNDGNGNQTWAGFGNEIEISEGLEPGTYHFKILFAITGTGVPGILENGPFVSTFSIEGPSIPETLEITGALNTEECLNASVSIAINNATIENGAIADIRSGGNITAGNFVVSGGGIALLTASEAISMGDGVLITPGAGGLFQAKILPFEPCVLVRSVLASEEGGYTESFPESASSEPFFRLFPNPTPGRFVLQLNEVEADSVNFVEIYSIVGESILKSQFSGSLQFEFDISGNPRGVYIVRLISSDKMAVEKIVKQ